MLLSVPGGPAVALHDLGDGREEDRPPLLFAHATGFHGRVWRAFAAELADAFHPWAIDFRGHGDSAVPEGFEPTWDDFADDVLAAVDALAAVHGHRGPMAGVGHSKGGAALLTAELRRPGTFTHLWVYEPIVFPPIELPVAPNNVNLSEGAARRRAVFPSRQDAIDNYASKPPLNRLRPDVLHDYVEFGFADTPDGEVTLKCRPDVEAATYRNGPLLRTWDRLPELDTKVIVAASGDGGFPAMNAPNIVDRIPGAVLVTHDELTHFGPLEDPTRLAADVRRFLRR